MTMDCKKFFYNVSRVALVASAVMSATIDAPIYAMDETASAAASRPFPQFFVNATGNLFADKTEQTHTEAATVKAVMALRKKILRNDGSRFTRRVNLQRNPADSSTVLTEGMNIPRDLYEEYSRLPQEMQDEFLLARLPEHIQPIVNIPMFDVFEDVGDQKCGWHAIGLAPQKFVETCIEILHGTDQRRMQDVLKHVLADAVDIAGDCNLGKHNESDITFQRIFERDSLADLTAETILPYFIDTAKLAEHHASPIDFINDQGLSNLLIRKNVYSDVLNKGNIIAYLWGRYVGNEFVDRGIPHNLTELIPPIDGAQIHAASMTFIANVAEIGVFVISTATRPTKIVTTPVFLDQCLGAINGEDDTLKARALSLIAHLAWDFVFNHYQDGVARHATNLLYNPMDPGKTSTVDTLLACFPGIDLTTVQRDGFIKWFQNPTNLQSIQNFIVHRFVMGDFTLHLNGSPALDTLASSPGFVKIPSDYVTEFMPELLTLPKDRSGQEQRAVDLREINYQWANIYAERTVFLWLSCGAVGGHYSTILPADLCQSSSENTFGYLSYFKQMIFEELHWLHVNSAHVDRKSLGEYVDALRAIFPDLDEAFKGWRPTIDSGAESLLPPELLTPEDMVLQWGYTVDELIATSQTTEYLDSLTPERFAGLDSATLKSQYLDLMEKRPSKLPPKAQERPKASDRQPPITTTVNDVLAKYGLLQADGEPNWGPLYSENGLGLEDVKGMDAHTLHIYISEVLCRKPVANPSGQAPIDSADGIHPPSTLGEVRSELAKRLPIDWTAESYLGLNSGLSNMFSRPRPAGWTDADILANHYIKYGAGKLDYLRKPPTVPGSAALGEVRPELAKKLPIDWTAESYLGLNSGLSNMFPRPRPAGWTDADVLANHYIKYGAGKLDYLRKPPIVPESHASPFVKHEFGKRGDAKDR